MARGGRPSRQLGAHAGAAGRDQGQGNLERVCPSHLSTCSRTPLPGSAHARTHTHTHTRTHARTHARTHLAAHSLSVFFVCPCRPHGWAYLDMMMIGARPGSYMRRPSLVIHTLPCHHWITSLQFLEGETESFLERQGGLTPTGTKKTKERAFLCTLCECSDDGAWRQHHVAATYLCRCFVQGSRLNAFCCCWPTRANREQNTAQDVGTAAPSS